MTNQEERFLEAVCESRTSSQITQAGLHRYKMELLAEVSSAEREKLRMKLDEILAPQHRKNHHKQASQLSVEVHTEFSECNLRARKIIDAKIGVNPRRRVDEL